MNVRETGIDEGTSEVIVTTRSASGTFNAAPIGIITTTNEHFVKLYKSSRTFTNVQETKKLAANVTSDLSCTKRSELMDTIPGSFGREKH
jgi:hypothetical protein